MLAQVRLPSAVGDIKASQARQALSRKEILINIEELKKICQQQIYLQVGNNPQVSLKQPGKWGKTNYRWLLGVKGEIVQDNFGDGMIVLYPAKELLSVLETLSRKGQSKAVFV